MFVQLFDNFIFFYFFPLHVHVPCIFIIISSVDGAATQRSEEGEIQISDAENECKYA